MWIFGGEGESGWAGKSEGVETSSSMASDRTGEITHVDGAFLSAFCASSALDDLYSFGREQSFLRVFIGIYVIYCQGAFLNDVWKYNPSSNSWTDITPASGHALDSKLMMFERLNTDSKRLDGCGLEHLGVAWHVEISGCLSGIA